MGFDVGGITLTSPGTTLAVASGATPWMNVNANGVLTRPQTPFMSGQITGLGDPYNATPLKVTADQNVGSCWNNTTGLFTCPVAGYYMMTGGNIAHTQAGYLYLRKNGVDMHFTHWNHTTTWHYVNFSGVISCAAGDALAFAIGGLTPPTTGFYGGGGHNMYSIALMA